MNIYDIREKFVNFLKADLGNVHSYLKTRFGDDLRFVDGEPMFNPEDVIYTKDGKTIFELAVFNILDDMDCDNCEADMRAFLDIEGIEHGEFKQYVPRDNGADYDCHVSVEIF